MKTPRRQQTSRRKQTPRRKQTSRRLRAGVNTPQAALGLGTVALAAYGGYKMRTTATPTIPLLAKYVTAQTSFVNEIKKTEIITTGADKVILVLGSTNSGKEDVLKQLGCNDEEIPQENTVQPYGFTCKTNNVVYCALTLNRQYELVEALFNTCRTIYKTGGLNLILFVIPTGNPLREFDNLAIIFITRVFPTIPVVVVRTQFYDRSEHFEFISTTEFDALKGQFEGAVYGTFQQLHKFNIEGVDKLKAKIGEKQLETRRVGNVYTFIKSITNFVTEHIHVTGRN
jgi:hypothetical protein